MRIGNEPNPAMRPPNAHELHLAVARIPAQKTKKKWRIAVPRLDFCAAWG